MDINEIQSLIKFVAKSGVSEVEIESKGFKIVIKTPAKDQRTLSEQITVPVHAHVAHLAPAPVVVHQAQPLEVKSEPAPADNEGKYITIKSPMIGTFYRSAGPDKPSFINIGDEIQPGKVLCIIEAMKLFNEIEADISGRIVKVLVDDAKPIEYDQPLFLVEPN